MTADGRTHHAVVLRENGRGIRRDVMGRRTPARWVGARGAVPGGHMTAVQEAAARLRRSPSVPAQAMLPRVAGDARSVQRTVRPPVGERASLRVGRRRAHWRERSRHYRHAWRCIAQKFARELQQGIYVTGPPPLGQARIRTFRYLRRIPLKAHACRQKHSTRIGVTIALPEDVRFISKLKSGRGI